MRDRKVTPDMVPVIKLALSLGYPYSALTGYYPGLNFGRVADIKMGRRFADIPPATKLPADFPTMVAVAA